MMGPWRIGRINTRVSREDKTTIGDHRFYEGELVETRMEERFDGLTPTLYILVRKGPREPLVPVQRRCVMILDGPIAEQ